jgi:WD40 repeat protein
VTLYEPDGRPRQTLDAVTGRVAEVVIAPNGTWSATVGSSGAVVLWDIDPATGLWTLREELVGHAGDVVDAEITPESDQLVTAGRDRRLVVWDASVGGGFGTAVPGFGDRFPTAPPQVVEPGRVAVAPTMPIESADPAIGTAELTAAPVAATFFDPVTGDVLQEVAVGTAVPGNEPFPSVSVSPDRSMVAVMTGSTVSVLDSFSRLEIGQYVPPRAGSGPALPTCIGWTPDSLLVVCVNDVWGSALRAVDPRSREELRSNGGLGLGMNAMATDPAGNRLAVTGREEGVVAVLDARTFEVTRSVSSTAVTRPEHLSFSPDGRQIAVAGEGGLTVIDTDAWRAAPAPAPLTADVLQVEWFPDGRTVAVAGSDRTVYLYDVDQGHVRALPLPTARTGSAPDGAVHVLPGISDELVVLGGSQPGRRYPLDPGIWTDFACAVAGRDLTEEEWTRYLPGREHRPTCTDLE